MKEFVHHFKERITHIPKDIRHLLAAGAWNLQLHLLHLEFSNESQENLNEANRLLEDNSLVMYVNHTSMKDAPVAVAMVFNSLTNAKQIVGPAGMKHFDMKRDWKNGALLRLLKPLGIGVLPVVQSDDRGSYGNQERMRMIEEFREQTRAALSQPGSVCGIAPEGTRNKFGKLQRGHKTIAHLQQYNDDLYFVPVGIAYKEFTDHPMIVVGKPLRLVDIIPPEMQLPTDPEEKMRFLKQNAQLITDLHMKRLAALLPEEMRGEYAL